MKIKILKVPDYMKLTLKYGNDYVLIDPVFNREGFYFDRISKKCWVEYDGVSFTCKNMEYSFESELKKPSSRSITDLEYNATLNVLAYCKLSQKTKNELYNALYSNSFFKIALKRRLIFFGIKKISRIKNDI